MARAAWEIIEDPPRVPETRFRQAAMHGVWKGCQNGFRLCLDCGYPKARMRAWQMGHRASMVEFKRLAASKSRTDEKFM